MRKLILSIGIIICAVVKFFGQDIQVTARFDTNSIYIGDQIYFTVKVEKPVETQISLPLIKDTLYKSIEIISGPHTDTTVLESGRNAIIQKYLITSFDSGFFRVPPVFAELNSTNSLKRFYSDYSILAVSRVNVAPQDSTDVIYDIIKPYRAPLTIGEILPWVLLLLVLAVLTWYAIRFVRNRRKRKPGEEEPVIIEPAHIIALRDLERLRDEELWQNGEVKLYYTRLTEILRQYLENRYSIMSLELTTDETLSIYKKTVHPVNEVYNILKSVLVDADLVKFAKFKPESSDNESAFDNSWNFVSLTMVKQEESEYQQGDKTIIKKGEGLE